MKYLCFAFIVGTWAIPVVWYCFWFVLVSSDWCALYEWKHESLLTKPTTTNLVEVTPPNPDFGLDPTTGVHLPRSQGWFTVRVKTVDGPASVGCAGPIKRFRPIFSPTRSSGLGTNAKIASSASWGIEPKHELWLTRVGASPYTTQKVSEWRRTLFLFGIALGDCAYQGLKRLFCSKEKCTD